MLTDTLEYSAVIELKYPVTLLTGNSGAGKTLLFDIITDFYGVYDDENSVTIVSDNGVAFGIKKYTADSLKVERYKIL